MLAVSCLFLLLRQHSSSAFLFPVDEKVPCALLPPQFTNSNCLLGDSTLCVKPSVFTLVCADSKPTCSMVCLTLSTVMKCLFRSVVIYGLLSLFLRK